MYNICYRKTKSVGLFALTAYDKLVAYEIQDKEVIKLWGKNAVFGTILRSIRAGIL